jgi:hypothetical protein
MNEKTFSIVLQKVALELLSRIVYKTPVDTGRARGNWQVTLDTPATGYNTDKKDGTGTAAIAEGVSVITQAPNDGLIWITNNLPYIERLENGWSNQAPAGMVKVALEEVMTMIAQPTRGGS